jgi:nucleoside-diphosphate-sugar epimerase
MPSFLVTGATGFIGSHLVDSLLDRGAKVRCLVRSLERGRVLRERGVELIFGDLDRPASLTAALEGIRTVYHLAGCTKSLSAAEMFRINEGGCAALARIGSLQRDPPRLVIVSSIAAAGPTTRGNLRREGESPHPVSNYGRSKLAGELAAARYADRAPTTIVRPGIVFGPRDPALAKAFRTIRRLWVHPSPGWFPPALSYIYVADLVEILLRAAERGARISAAENGSPGRGRYFAVASEYPTYAELGRMARPMLSRHLAPVVPLAGPAVWCVAGANEVLSRLRGRPDELNLDKIREALAESWACSGESARRELAFTPPRPLVERLHETIEWYAREGWL